MYIAHIQWKYFHMRITNAEKKISQLKAILKKYVLRAVLKDVRLCFFLTPLEDCFTVWELRLKGSVTKSVGTHSALAGTNKVLSICQN